MIDNKAKDEFYRLCSAGKSSGPVSESVIERAQSELSMSFPEEYMDFLRRYGTLVAPGVSIYGLPNAAQNARPFWNDIMVETKKLQKLGQAGAEDSSFLPFSDDGMGVYFFLNTRASPRTEIWAIGPGVEKLLPTSLYQFTLDLAAGRVLL